MAAMMAAVVAYFQAEPLMKNQPATSQTTNVIPTLIAMPVKFQPGVPVGLA